MELRDLKKEAGHLWARGRFDQAEVLLRQMLQVHPGDNQLWIRHAEALQRLERFGEAVESYRRAAQLLEQLGRYPRAVAARRLALKLKPEDIDLMSELIQMELRKNLREPGFPNPRSAHGAEADDEGLSLPSIGDPGTHSDIAIEVSNDSQWPHVRRLSPTSVALKANPDARWVIVRSASELLISFDDELPEAKGDKVHDS